MSHNNRLERYDLKLRSEAVQEVLGLVPHWMIRWGNSLIFSLVLGVFSISYFIKYPDVLNSEMTITTANPPHNSFSEINGELEQVLVSDGTKVTKGQLLATLTDGGDKKQTLVSSTNGVVYFSNFWEANMLVKKGKLLFSTVPENHGPYIGKIAIQQSQLNAVFIGQQVRFALSESFFFGGETSAKGHITRIAKIANEENMVALEVELDDDGISLLKEKKLSFQPGMKTEVKIITEDLRLLERFFYTVKDIFK